jgi:hypothetical protein
LSPNICFSRLARSTFCQRPIRFPPERCAFSPPRSLARFWRPRNLFKLRVGALAVNPLRSQDFHLISTVRGVASLGAQVRARSAGVNLGRGNSFYSASENALPLQFAEIFRRRPKRKTVQKLKITWRLCYARKPFRNLVPECKPRKGARWRLTEFDAPSPRDDSTESSDTCSLVLDWFVIPK